MQTRVIRARLSELKLLEKNARYMKGPQFNRLVENIRRDGCLTSFPLVHRDGEALVVVSGNHRVSAAIKAGIEESDVIEVTSPLTRQQFVALQLSHNAIAGQDDPNILRSLYDELDFGWKEYSGLTDDAFNIDELDTSVLRVEQPFYEELTISFLPGDAEVFTGWLDKIGKSKAARSPGRPLRRLRRVLRAGARREGRQGRPQHGRRTAADGRAGGRGARHADGGRRCAAINPRRRC